MKMKPGEAVLLHCNIGNGGSPTVAAAWLHWYQGWKLEDAVEHVPRCRECESNTFVIRAAEAAGLPERCSGPAPFHRTGRAR